MKNFESTENQPQEAKAANSKPCPFLEMDNYEQLVGKSLFMRTVTYHVVGKVEKVVGTFLLLSNASWVASSGRFMNAIKEGKLDEVEPLGEWAVNYNTITDMGEWKHSLDIGQK